MFFERFLLRWHDGTVDEIEQLAKEYDALIPRLHPELKDQIIASLSKVIAKTTIISSS